MAKLLLMELVNVGQMSSVNVAISALLDIGTLSLQKVVRLANVALVARAPTVISVMANAIVNQVVQENDATIVPMVIGILLLLDVLGVLVPASILLERPVTKRLVIVHVCLE